MKMSFLKTLLLGSAMAVILASAAQAGPFDGWYDEDTSYNTKAAGLQFHQTLFTEYQKLSADRNAAWGDGTDAELFNHKALLASTETAVQYDSVDDRDLKSEERPQFIAGIDRLRSVYDRGGRDLAPVETAVAQVSFDCWIEATEGARADDAKACKIKFEKALDAAEAKADRQLGQVKVVAPEPAPAPAPAPAALPPQEYYRVPFVFDTTRLTPEGEQILAQAIRDVKDLTQLKIALRAHADRSGPNDYNLKLSKRRAEVILNRMSDAGIAQDRLRIVEAVGESRSLIPTADGIKEQGNRVVEIDLRQ